MKVGKKLFKNLIKMSSKEQLTDYIKRLKKEVQNLKSENKELKSMLAQSKKDVQYLFQELQKSHKKERKWYHFF